MRRFRMLAEAAGAMSAWTNEDERDVVSVMGRVAEELEWQGCGFKAFGERYRMFRQRRQELEADPEAPPGLAMFFGRVAGKVAVKMGRRAPVVGGLADLVDEDEFSKQTGDLAQYVARKVGNKAEVYLVREPVAVLTPLFLEELRQVAEGRTVALFFDTYETTSTYLERWLVDVLAERYGAVSENTLWCLAGREPLDYQVWERHADLVTRFALDPFTDAEAPNYLTRQGVTDEKLVEVILKLSGRLPLLLALLADESPRSAERLEEVADTAVERFLRWIEDPKQRQAALDTALARRFNRDVVATVTSEAEADELFEWLGKRPFVDQRADGWLYHEVVRTLTPLQTQVVALNLLAQWLRATYPEAAIARVI